MNYLIILILLHLSNVGYSQNMVKEDTCTIHIANSLTRNDGDKLIINSDCELFDFNFKIYNRWGEMMYEKNHFQTPMDFDLHEKVLVNGEEKYKFPKNETFIWVMTYKSSIEKSESIILEKSGSITIL